MFQDVGVGYYVAESVIISACLRDASNILRQINPKQWLHRENTWKVKDKATISCREYLKTKGCLIAR